MEETIVQTVSWAQAFLEVGVAFAVAFSAIGIVYCISKW